jgi:protoporphyrinogen oxidase
MRAASCRDDSVIILGAGLAGLGCALTFERAGAPFRLLESEPTPGGLARSATRDGFTFDLAGHWLHVRDLALQSLLNELLGPDLLEIERAAWIHIDGRWVPYPFQTNLWALRADVRDECLEGYLNAQWREDDGSCGDSPSDFYDAALRMWGYGIARHFVVPYNEKLWGFPLCELVPDWAGRFLPRPAADEVLRGAHVRQDGGGYNARFFYPRRAGMGLIAQRLGEQLGEHISLNCRVAGVDLAARRVKLADGRSLRYGRLVSTLPLPTLIRLCGDAPPSVRAAARGLRATGVSCVHIAVRGPLPAEVPHCHWAYFPELRFPFYRVGSTSAAVPGLAPPGCRSFTVEFSQRSGPETRPLQAWALAGLQDCGLVRLQDDVLFIFTQEIPCAYVVRDRECEWRRQQLLGWFLSQGVHSIGRYGGWQYSSMEDAFLEGQKTAHEILGEVVMAHA